MKRSVCACVNYRIVVTDEARTFLYAHDKITVYVHAAQEAGGDISCDCCWGKLCTAQRTTVPTDNGMVANK